MNDQSFEVGYGQPDLSASPIVDMNDGIEWITPSYISSHEPQKPLTPEEQMILKIQLELRNPHMMNS